MVGLLVACRDTGRPPPPAAAPPAARAGDPWAVPDEPPDTPERRRGRIDAALERVPDLVLRVADLRGLRLLRPVPSRYQSKADFRAFVEREVVHDLPPARSRELSAAMMYLGFLTAPVDIAKAEADASSSQAAAYYDPHQRAFFVVQSPQSEDAFDLISAHELTHALQDQSFDLDKYLAPATPRNTDAELARRYIVEGDATFTMFMYQAAKGGRKAAGDWLMKLTRGVIDRYASMAPAEAMSAFTAMGGLDDDSKAANEALAHLPPLVAIPLLQSYFQGAEVAIAAYDTGGWDEVDDLFRHPPDSTAQVLHPKDKLVRRHWAPHRVTIPRIDGITAVDDDVIGELRWSIYFGLWLPDEHDVASGWAGDRYWVGKLEDGRLMAELATIWDSDVDAIRFADAFKRSLAARFPEGHVAADGGFPRPGGGAIYVRTQRSRVYIADGATDPAALDDLVAGTTFDPPSN